MPSIDRLFFSYRPPTLSFKPPRKWSVTIDGHTITPKTVQQTLRRCREAGADMEFIAAHIGVGAWAILEYLDNEKTIPEYVAERFYRFFVSGIPIPKASPEKLKPTMWEETAEDRRPKEIRRMALTPDFDSEPLGKLLKERRLARGMTLNAAAKVGGCAGSYIAKLENGKILHYHGNCKSIFKLCEFFGVDVVEYELKPRVNFQKFQQLIRDCKSAAREDWPTLAARSGVAKKWIMTYLASRTAGVSLLYLDDRVTLVMAAYGLDLNLVLTTKGRERLNGYGTGGV